MRALYRLMGLGTVACALLVAAGEVGRVIPLFDILVSFRPHLALASSGFAFAALLVRRWCLATLSITGCIWATITSMTTGACPLPPEAGPAVSVLTFNVWGGNLDLEAIEDRIREADADLVVLQEYRTAHSPIGSALADLYPERANCAQERGCRLALFARNRWQTMEISGRAGRTPPMVKARFPAVGDRPGFTLIGTHIDRPFGIAGQQQRDLAILLNQIRLEDGPLVVVGDFNAVPWSFALRAFRADTGLCGAAGYRPSWPAALDAVGLPIDQVFISKGLGVATQHLPPAGSDHLPIRAEVRWR